MSPGNAGPPDSPRTSPHGSDPARDTMKHSGDSALQREKVPEKGRKETKVLGTVLASEGLNARVLKGPTNRGPKPIIARGN